MILRYILFFGFTCSVYTQNIGGFTSVEPIGQNKNFVIPSTHVFQKIIEEGDALTQGGVLPDYIDFTGYVPINGSSTNGYLSINSEMTPGGVSILEINLNSSTKIWETTLSQRVNFNSVAGTAKNCSGTVTPWNTVISCEEIISTIDSNNDGYNDLGWCVEINPSTKSVIDKRWALGNFKHENIVVHNNQRTVYEGADSNPGYLYKFVADNIQDLSIGKLYVFRGSKSGSGNWIRINNSTKTDRNSTISQSTNVNATIFNGVEDVEIGPDGWIYFAVKGENKVYRFQDSNPITGTTIPKMETYVGNMTYNIIHNNGTSSVYWGYGNDNLAFDGNGNLWVLQDGENNYIWVVENDHTQTNPKVKIFGNTPAGSEPTGITFSPNYRYLFMSIMHPNNTNNGTTQIDAAGNTIGFNKDISLVVALNDHLGTNSSNNSLETPSNFTAQADEGKVTLSWDANTETDLVSYTLYRGMINGGWMDYLASVYKPSTSYIDYNIDPYTTYYYQIDARDIFGNTSTRSNQISTKTLKISGENYITEYSLTQNYPNPFNPRTTISYELPSESNISIKIYDLFGNEVKSLLNDFKQVGHYQVTWDGTDNSGQIVSGATYFCQLKAGEYTETKKLVLLK